MTRHDETQSELFEDAELRGGLRPAKRSLSYHVVAMLGHVALLLDPVCILASASLSTWLYTHGQQPLEAVLGNDMVQAGWVAAVLAPFILYDSRFGALASRGQLHALLRSHVLRFLMLAVGLAGLGLISQAVAGFPPAWLALWFATTLVVTSLTRLLVAQGVRRLQRGGVLSEVIAVIGAGPVADRLVHTLLQPRSQSIELLGVFDDRIARAEPGAAESTGTLEHLLELGKTRKIDWIVVTLPPTAEGRLLAIVQRLKALSVPIGLCPQHVGSALPYRAVDFVGGSLPVAMLADRPRPPGTAALQLAEELVPRWIITLVMLPVAVLRALADQLAAERQAWQAQGNARFSFHFDPYDLAGFTNVAASYGQSDYGYVVTPNADHLIRLHEDHAFRALYAAADYILLDSRFLSHLLRVARGLKLPVCTGSDLTASLFANVISPDDPLVLIGCSDAQARQLVERYGLRGLVHFNPPMGFIHDPEAVEACLQFVESHSPFRFCLLAIGSPQQETIARMLKERGVARGMALCIGASINFLTGEERRAPRWVQHCGAEWLFRLMQAPGRLGKRYLVRGPRVFSLLRHADIVLRKRAPAPLMRLVPASDHAVVLPVNSPAPLAQVEH